MNTTSIPPQDIPDFAVRKDWLLGQLHDSVTQLVSISFFETLMESSRNGAFKGDLGHGGRGEEVFGGQLDRQLAMEMSKSPKFGVTQNIYQDLAKIYDRPRGWAEIQRMLTPVNVVG
ncbi:MAG: hypothetical protein HJJLKODD_00482 [Phycisphaerae bacterium]|nr:hypothetical protein [Phycisphaerae bacterium]